MRHNINHLALSDLLKLLKTSDIDSNNLPLDALLSTPKTLEIRKIEPGIYYYFDLSEAIKKLYKDNNSNIIRLLINIDGIFEQKFK